MKYKRALKLGIGLALLAGLFISTNVSEALKTIGRAKPDLYILAVGIFLTTYVAAAIRWKSLMETTNIDLDFNESFRLISVSYGFNKLFPGNSGDLARSKITERYKEISSHGNVLGVVALERFLDMASVVLVLGFGLLFVASAFYTRIIWIVTPFVAIVALLSTALFIRQDLVDKLIDLSPERFESFLTDVMDGYRSCPRRKLFSNLLYSLYIWFAEAVMFYVLVQSLSFNTGLWEGTVVTSVMSLVSALPISPGGIGAVDITGTGLLVFSGLDKTGALSLVILQRSISLALSALLGTSIYLIETIRSRPE